VLADAVVRIDVDEHARRRATGVAAVTNLPLLRTLLTLPAHEPVRRADLSDRQRALVDQAGAGVTEVTPESVTRRLLPPVAVPLVVVRERRGWRPSLVKASRFSSLLPTVILLDREPQDWSERAWEADLAGVGVLVRRGANVTTLLAPRAGHPPMTVRAARWRFLERAYLTWLTGSRLRSAAPFDHAGHRVRPGAGELDLFDGGP
jgi:hypothetical protein